METKPRILYLKKILEERTDEEHPLSTTQLINILNDEYGISAHRTTVTKDIAALQEFGMDIVTTPIVFVGGGAVVMKNFGSHDAKNISYNLDVKANARGYEQLAMMGLKSTRRLS